jgi:hypothetical protein
LSLKKPGNRDERVEKSDEIVRNQGRRAKRGSGPGPSQVLVSVRALVDEAARDARLQDVR